MFQSFIKSVGLAPLDAYVEPRLSIGTAVSNRPFSPGHFTVQVDDDARALIIKNDKDKTLWKCKRSLWHCSLLKLTGV